ncbi:cation transporter [Kineococcus sp. NPDC059986]|jgi:copper chaperone CopZ|uniref:heavy-metal-associated domain-containing protein n=1 Tax=Kineococcus sp. NPDC059986 TaxID=3155538 RepID=UPI00344CBBF7
MSSTTAFGVTGMTCAHCVAAVTEEVSALSGVEDVRIELVPDGTSTVTVTATSPLEESAVAAAVDEAGYELVR